MATVLRSRRHRPSKRHWVVWQHSGVAFTGHFSTITDKASASMGIMRRSA
jgi:hypothetical protein